MGQRRSPPYSWLVKLGECNHGSGTIDSGFANGCEAMQTDAKLWQTVLDPSKEPTAALRAAQESNLAGDRSKGLGKGVGICLANQPSPSSRLSKPRGPAGGRERSGRGKAVTQINAVTRARRKRGSHRVRCGLH